MKSKYLLLLFPLLLVACIDTKPPQSPTAKTELSLTNQSSHVYTEAELRQQITQRVRHLQFGMSSVDVVKMIGLPPSEYVIWPTKDGNQNKGFIMSYRFNDRQDELFESVALYFSPEEKLLSVRSWNTAELIDFKIPN
jgi:hypothetical protein